MERRLWTVPCVYARDEGMKYRLLRQLWSRP
jgi:hypothetical protein